MFRSEQTSGKEFSDIRSNRTYTNSRSSPAHSVFKNSPPRHNTATDYYARSPVANGWSNKPREYPISDRYTINDREDDKCTISTRQSFETAPNYEDCVSFFSAPTPTPMDPDSDGKDDSDGSEAGVPFPDTENNTLTNFGPKMRFVSPPPWEFEGRLHDDDRDDNISISDGLSVLSGRFGPRKHREPEKVSIRSLALASMRTPSPTPTTSSRRSPYGKSNPNASQSQVSLSTPNSAPWASRSTIDSPSSERPSFSLSSRDKGAPSLGPLTERSLQQKAQTQSPRSPVSIDDVSPMDRSDSPVPLNQYTHPYANPNAISVSDSLKLSSGAEVLYHQQRKSNDSDSGYIRRASESAAVVTANTVTSTLRKGSAGNVPIYHSKPSRNTVLAKHEETEIALLPPTLRCRTDGLPPPAISSPHSFVPFPDSPLGTLMTLEEAQQRIKKTSSPESLIQTRVRTGSTLVAGFGLSAGADFEVRRNQPLSPLTPSDSSLTIRESKSPNARQRTASSSKLSIANSSPSNDETGSTKTLKHKKSGFMKLFGKDKDVPKEPMPKVDTPSTERILPVPKRVPPPSLSVVVTSPSISFSEIDTHLQNANVRPRSQKNLPTLSPAIANSVEAGRAQGGQFPDFRPILSAPPSQASFESLSLRPMSTVFSAKFSDLFSALDEPEEALAPPVMPAASQSSGGGSPTTSDFSSRSNSSDYPLTPSSTVLPGMALSIVERQEDTIASLQAQLTNIRKDHQREIWELESQIKDLKQENEELRNAATYETCGKSKREGHLKSAASASITGSVGERPRPKVSRDNRSVFGGN